MVLNIGIIMVDDKTIYFSLFFSEFLAVLNPRSLENLLQGKKVQSFIWNVKLKHYPDLKSNGTEMTKNSFNQTNINFTEQFNLQIQTFILSD